MAKRKNIPNKLRFEVFKRDNFTCQYCGCSAPDVILNVDHITPVAKGGKNDILNLITSCRDCNSGKSDRLLSDNSAISKQREQLEELNERRNQLELLIQWRNDLESLNEDKLSYIIETINSNMIGFKTNRAFELDTRKLLKKYGVNILLEAIDISANKYIDHEDSDSYDTYLNKIKGIAENLSKPPLERKINHISGYATKSFNVRFWEVKQLLNEYSELLMNKWGYSEESVIEDLYTEVLNLIKREDNYNQFHYIIRNWIKDIKR